MARQWSPSDEARYDRYKKSVAKLGQREGDAAATAAAKVDRERQERGSATVKTTHAGDGRKPLEHRTIEELYLLARQRKIPGRSQMNKAELIEALVKT